MKQEIDIRRGWHGEQTLAEKNIKTAQITITRTLARRSAKSPYAFSAPRWAIFHDLKEANST